MSPRDTAAASTSSASTSATTADTVADIIREHGWKVPVGLDRDGAVSNLYRVGVCPTIVLAYPGGIVHDAAIRAGNYDAGEIAGLVDDLLAATRRARGRGPVSGRSATRPPLAARGSVDAGASRGVPRPLHPLARGRPRLGRSPRALKRRLAGLSDRFGGPQAITSRPSRSPGPTGSSTATSASTPTSSRPRSRQLALERMLKGGFRQQQPARRRADDRDDRVRRRRCARSTPTRSRAGSGSAPSGAGRGARGPPGRAAGRHARDRRRGAPAGAPVRRDRPPAAASARDRADRARRGRRRGRARDRRRGGALARAARSCCGG